MAAQVPDDEANAALVLAVLARCGSTTDPRYGPATIMQDDDTAGRCMDVDTVRRAMNRLVVRGLVVRREFPADSNYHRFDARFEVA